ncbi:sensor histidine kinase [Tritonibacter scottomollicae]|uniref:sensor histidine kinase n=1 Tax=Tritonibacter scottomollicae TaxID=483013 RepID=UPI003AA99011
MTIVSPRWISIKLKVALVVCLVSGASFSVFFAINYQDTIQRIHAHAEELILRNHETHTRYIVDTLTKMRQDSEMIVGFPPISGIIRTREAVDNRDPLDGSTLADWRARLETLFISIIGNRSGYSQIRLILAENNWSEFARVDQDNGDVQVVPQDDLQSKGEEPYIKALQADPTSDILFSNVTRNREHQRVSGPPMLRSMKRVVDEHGNLLGAIVVNADIASLLTVPSSSEDLGQTFYSVENSEIAGIPVADGDRNFYANIEGKPDTISLEQLASFPERRLVHFKDQIGVYISRVDTGNEMVPFTFRIATTVDLHDLYSAARDELWRNVGNALWLTILASGLGYLFSAKLLRPLQVLLSEINESSQILRPLSNRYRGNDEISDIAQNFTRLTNDLIRETQRLDMVLSNISEGILTLSEDGCIEDANPAASRILGNSEPELHGARLLELLGFDAEATQGLLADAAHAHAAEEAGVRELTMTRSDGSRIVLNLTLQHATYAGEGRFVAMIRDVTRRAAATERSEALIAALQRSNAELDQFAYVASHDLKAPLRVISNAVVWLEEDLEPYLTDDTRESMNLLKSRTSRMERLLNDLLQHSRIGRVAEPETRVPGKTMAEELLQLLEVPEGMSISFSDGFLDLHMRKFPLETIFVNLIGNGIKHHDREVGQITVNVEQCRAGWRFRVEDDGPGIEPAYHQRIFKVFQTLKSRDQLESSGMGLAFVKKYIDVAGGDIKILSDGERGTIFEFFWPFEKPQQDQAA